jgi:hypothetical protein
VIIAGQGYEGNPSHAAREVSYAFAGPEVDNARAERLAVGVGGREAPQEQLQGRSSVTEHRPHQSVMTVRRVRAMMARSPRKLRVRT